MNYFEIKKGDMNEKYFNMLDGKVNSQNKNIEIKSLNRFQTNYNTLSDRLKREINEINDGLQRIKSEKIKRVNRDNENIARREQRKKTIKDVIETILQVICLVSPIICTIVFGDILYKNEEQISIISDFSKWHEIWIFFSVFAVLISILLLINRLTDWKVHDAASTASSTIIAISVLTCSIYVASITKKLSSDFNPTQFIEISLADKTTSKKKSTYYSTISFKLDNISDVNITYILGEMKIYNDNVEIGSWDIAFDGEYKGGESYIITITFDETKIHELYNTTYSNMVISYRITSMRFNGKPKEYIYDGEVKTLNKITK